MRMIISLFAHLCAIAGLSEAAQCIYNRTIEYSIVTPLSAGPSQSQQASPTIARLRSVNNGVHRFVLVWSESGQSG